MASSSAALTGGDVVEFYDFLAPDYPDMFASYTRSVTAEAKFIDRELKHICGRSEALTLIDPTCGRGWHARALASLGWKVHGTDCSPRMVALAKRDAEKFGPKLRANLKFDVLDVRHLDGLQGNQLFNGAVCLGNSICCLRSKQDLVRAFSQIRTQVAAGAPFILGTRNYDRDVENHKTLDGPLYYRTATERRKVLQVWHWDRPCRNYRNSLYIATQQTGSMVWRCRPHQEIICRAWRRKDITRALEAARFKVLRILTRRGRAAHSVFRTGFDEVMFIALAR